MHMSIHMAMHRKLSASTVVASADTQMQMGGWADGRMGLPNRILRLPLQLLHHAYALVMVGAAVAATAATTAATTVAATVAATAVSTLTAMVAATLAATVSCHDGDESTWHEAGDELRIRAECKIICADIPKDVCQP